MKSNAPICCKCLTATQMLSFPTLDKSHVSLFVMVNNFGFAIKEFMYIKHKFNWSRQCDIWHCKLSLPDSFDILNAFGCLISGLLVDTLMYCGKMPSSPSFHPPLSLLDISFIWNVIIILFFILSLSECVIKCFKFRCIWMLCRSWTMIKCVWEVPVWCYQLFAAWQRFHQKQTLFSLWIWTVGFEKRP